MFLVSLINSNGELPTLSHSSDLFIWTVPFQTNSEETNFKKKFYQKQNKNKQRQNYEREYNISSVFYNLFQIFCVDYFITQYYFVFSSLEIHKSLSVVSSQPA